VPQTPDVNNRDLAPYQHAQEDTAELSPKMEACISSYKNVGEKKNGPAFNIDLSFLHSRKFSDLTLSLVFAFIIYKHYLIVMWCCKSNSAAAVENHGNVSKNRKQQEEPDTNSTSATNNSDDGSGTTPFDHDASYHNFIVEQLSENGSSSGVTFHDKNHDEESTHGKEKEQHEIASRNSSGFIHDRKEYDDDDDNITTVYSEETPLPKKKTARRKDHPSYSNSSNYHIGGSIDRDVTTKHTRTVVHEHVLHEKLYVMLPDVPQRGYEPEGLVMYPPRDKWIRVKPYKLGTLVWYRFVSSYVRFKWYIPGEITDYVLSDNFRVEGYVIQVDCKDHILERHEHGITSILKNAPPENTILRWDECIPPCPVEGIDHNINTSSYYGKHLEDDSSWRNAKQKYGEDLGFLGAKQNGVG